jgi:adenine deaminase
MNSGKLISVARGLAPADLILKNARIVNVFSGEIEQGNVAVCEGNIAGIGDYREAREIVDLDGKYLVPGFIDGHVHLESSMLSAPQYARAVVPRGTLSMVTDLHEIANVAGIEGLRYVLNSARKLPLDVFLMAPSCVPATHLETSGADLDAVALKQILRWKETIGLGEMMNFPGVLNRDDGVLSKLRLASGKPSDGHAPGLSGRELNAYVAAGIQSDHESTTLEEAKEKLRRGVYVMIREGSSEKNLEALLPIVTERTLPRCMLVVDDRTCVDLLKDGDLDAVVRKAVGLGLDPISAIQMVTLNPATYFGLEGLGAVAPGYRANLVVIDDLISFRISLVFHNGQMVAREGEPVFKVGSAASNSLGHTVSVKSLRLGALRFPSTDTNGVVEVPVIEIVPGQIVTRRRQEQLRIVNGDVLPEVSRDILKAAVIERHKFTGNVGVGFVRGFGLKAGALGSSVAHDSHNIVAIGTDDTSILTAVAEIERLQGGLVAANGNRVIASLPLPVAGLLSERSMEETVSGLANVESAASGLGSRLDSPFSTLSFLALPVIPDLRLTDLGLVDVNEFRLIS